MSVEIVSAGPMLTIQDKGRTGLRHLGVSDAGPVDAAAMALANALCGNAPGAAALEFAGPAGSFTTRRPLRFAVAGGDCDIRIDDRVVPAGESHRLKPGEVLRIGLPRDVVWAYLAFSGGINSAVVLGSRATHLRTALGGIEGRCLRGGDVLPLGADQPADPCLRPGTPLQGASLPRGQGPIRVVPGPQQDYFETEVLDRLTSAEFLVTPQRDRMAMVLGDVPLPAARGHDIVSDGTVPGSIQVPGSGQPLVLLAESQTTGGYPKIATVISADLPRLAQLPVGSRVRFAAVSRDEGERIALARARALREALAALVAKPEGALRSDYLLSCDLVGGIVFPEEVVWADVTTRQEGRP